MRSKKLTLSKSRLLAIASTDAVVFIIVDLIYHQLNGVFGEQLWMVFLIVTRNLFELAGLNIHFNPAI